LNETFDLTSHLTLDESQAHLSEAEASNTVNLENVTARVSLRQTSKRFVRKDSAVHVSLSSDSIVKQQTDNRAFALNSRNFFNLTVRPGGQEPVELKKNRFASAAQGSVAVGGRYIGPGAVNCQHGIQKIFSNRVKARQL
jgi:hypothetical protein